MEKRAYASLRGMNSKYIARNRRRRGGGGLGGFSLIELLVVISIMVMLLSIAGTALTTPGSRSQEAGDRLSSAVSLAAAHAAAKNRLVWVKIGPQEEVPTDLEIRFYHSLDGTNREDSVKEFRRAVVLEKMRVSAELPEFGDRPRAEGSDRMKDGGMLVIKPTGELYMVSDQDGYPMPEGGLRMISEIGLQTVRGRTGIPNQKDVAALQLRGISAHSHVYTP